MNLVLLYIGKICRWYLSIGFIFVKMSIIQFYDFLYFFLPGIKYSAVNESLN